MQHTHERFVDSVGKKFALLVSMNQTSSSSNSSYRNFYVYLYVAHTETDWALFEILQFHGFLISTV